MSQHSFGAFRALEKGTLSERRSLADASMNFESSIGALTLSVDGPDSGTSLPFTFVSVTRTVYTLSS